MLTPPLHELIACELRTAHNPVEWLSSNCSDLHNSACHYGDSCSSILIDTFAHVDASMSYHEVSNPWAAVFFFGFVVGEISGDFELWVRAASPTLVSQTLSLSSCADIARRLSYAFSARSRQLSYSLRQQRVSKVLQTNIGPQTQRQKRSTPKFGRQCNRPSEPNGTCKLCRWRPERSRDRN